MNLLSLARTVLPLLATVAFAQSPPTISNVVNTADYSTRLSPGALASVYGLNFGSEKSAVRVTIGGHVAYVGAVTPGQINLQIPCEVAEGMQEIVATVGSISSAPFNAHVQKYSPALLTQFNAGAGPALVFDAQTDAPITASSPAKAGQKVYAYATGLGPTIPATSTGLAPAQAATAAQATLVIGGVSASVSYSGVIAQTAGTYQINFTVPPGVQGTQPMVLAMEGVRTSATVMLPVAGITRLVNNGSFASEAIAAPGSVATIFANGLGSSDQVTGFPADKFQGVQVSFNGKPAPMLHLLASANPQQIDVLLPNELPASGTVNVQLTTPNASYPSYRLNMVSADPGLYRIADPFNAKRSNVIAQFNETVWLAMPASMASALNLRGDCRKSGASPLSPCGEPASPGDYLALYLTGLGKATPNGDPNAQPLATGALPPADGSILYETVETPLVTLGGVPVSVVYSGLVPGTAGQYQIVFRVPSGATTGDDVPLTVSMGGRSDTATISIQPLEP